MRKLATIQKVKEINPIEGADLIERLTILGWEVVSQKNIHKVGDLVVYIEIDSFLPQIPQFEFLRKSSYTEKDISGRGGFVIRTAKLKGQISQGLCLPLSELQDIMLELGTLEGTLVFKEGDDITSLLKITKFEEPIPKELEGKAKGMFPNFLRDTDQERVQNFSSIINSHLGKEYVKFEKADGYSFTAYLKDGGFGVCSKGVEFLEDSSNPYWEVAHRLGLREKLLKLGRNIAINAELIGPGVRGNKYGLEQKTIRIFNIFDIDKYSSLDFEQFTEILLSLKLEEYIIPVTGQGFLESNISKYVEESNGPSILNPKILREGDVFRLKSNFNISFKVINPQFLLKHKE